MHQCTIKSCVLDHLAYDAPLIRWWIVDRPYKNTKTFLIKMELRRNHAGGGLYLGAANSTCVKYDSMKEYYGFNIMKIIMILNSFIEMMLIVIFRFTTLKTCLF